MGRCKIHGEVDDNEWDAPAAAEPVLALAQAVEESRDAPRV